MAYHFDGQCVYNIPMALDPTLSHTEGLQWQFARNRCKCNVSQCKDYIIGPMPPSEFMDYFFGPQSDSDTTRYMSSENAFNSVPVCSDSVEEICKPLVSSAYSCLPWAYDSPPICSGNGVEPTQPVQIGRAHV